MWSHKSERGRGDDKGRDGVMRQNEGSGSSSSAFSIYSRVSTAEGRVLACSVCLQNWSERLVTSRKGEHSEAAAITAREPSNFIGVHSTRPLARTTEKRSGVGAVACPCSATPGGARVLDDCRGFPLGWRRIEAERRGLRDI
ncbi:unnamed protein product [Lampetra fluviatilis]